MTLSGRSPACSLHDRPLCGIWPDLLSQLRTCSLRSRISYAFGREHESGTRSLGQKPQACDSLSGLGVAWYLHPNEGPSGAGRHVWYLSNTKEWRYLDADLFNALKEIVFAGHRSVAAVQRACILPESVFAEERLQVSKVPMIKREEWRQAWFERILQELAGCGMIFADPDNGLSPDDSFRPTQKKSAKSISLREANILAKDRPMIVYHHNTRRKGGHRAEIRYWQDQLPGEVYAFYWRTWSNRTFFVINADGEILSRLKCFATQWAGTKAELILPWLPLVCARGELFAYQSQVGCSAVVVPPRPNPAKGWEPTLIC